MTSRAPRWATLLAALTAFAAPASAGVQTTFTYDFTAGGPTTFSPTSTPPYGGASPTVMASTTTGAVTQSAFGLGVASGTGLGTEVGLSRFQIDNVGNALFGTTAPEKLSLKVNITNPSVVNARITQLSIFNPSLLNLFPPDDFAIYLNGSLVQNVNFPLSGNVPLSLSVTNGDTLTVQPLSPTVSNPFSVTGLQITADVIPEPASMAVFGALTLTAGVVGWRRRRATAA